MAYPAQDYANSFMMHRGALLDLIDKLPDDKGDFAPWEGARSLTLLLNHISDATETLTGVAVGKEVTIGEPSANLTQVKERLRSSTRIVQDMLSNASPEQLRAQVTALGMPWPAYKLLDFTREHEVHHKGQVWLMARLIGVEPPLLVKFG